MKNVIKPLHKNVVIPLWLTAAALATDAAIKKKMFGSGMTTVLISKKEMNDIMKTAKSLEEFGLLIQCVSEIIKNEANKQNGGFVGMLLDTIGATLLGNPLRVKAKLELVREQLELVRIFNAIYYQNEPKFNGV